MSASTSRVPVPGTQRLDIGHTLAPVARAIGLSRVARCVLVGFAVGAAIGAIVVAATHIHAFDWSRPAAVFAVIFGVLAGVLLGIARWPRETEAARAADLYFKLDDRLTTALELRTSDTPVAVLQGRDVAQRIDGLSLTRSRGRWLRRSEVAVAALAALALVAAFVLGPQTSGQRVLHAAAAQSNTQRVRHAAASQVQQLQSQLRLGLTPGQLNNPAMRKLDLALARLHRQLQQSMSRRASLRAISATQQQLQQLARSLHPVNAKAVAQLNSSLSHYLSKSQGAGTKGSPSHSSLQSAQALNRLAQSLTHLSAAQRAALARALAKTANNVSNNALRSSLRQAASSLANGNPQSAASALQQAAQQLAQSAGAQAAQSRSGVAGAQLNALKSQISANAIGLTPAQAARLGRGSTAQAGGQRSGRQNAQQGRGSGTAPGRGRGTGRGTRPGIGQGSALRPGRGNGRGQGRGRGIRAGTTRQIGGQTGNGTSGARGSGGQGRSRRTRNGQSVTVYVPGKQGQGLQIVRNGPNGAPAPGSLVPYQQVVGQYTQSAHQALDRSALPPSVQRYVRRYFNSISH